MPGNIDLLLLCMVNRSFSTFNILRYNNADTNKILLANWLIVIFVLTRSFSPTGSSHWHWI